MIEYSLANAPLQKELSAGGLLKTLSCLWFICSFHYLLSSTIIVNLNKSNGTDEVGNTAAFLASPLASAITGAVIYVDNGLNAMGVGVDSPMFADLNIPKDKH